MFISGRLFVFIGRMEGLEEENVPAPIEPEQRPVTERFRAGDVMPNGTVFDPDRHKINKNGSVQDITTGRFVTAPAPEHAPITRSNAKARAQKRWDDSRDEYAAGLVEGSIDPTSAPVKAWRQVGKKSMELLMNAKSARGFADLARFTGEAAGFIPMARGREDMIEEQADSGQVIVNLIFQYIAGQVEPAPDVIDAD